MASAKPLPGCPLPKAVIPVIFNETHTALRASATSFAETHQRSLLPTSTALNMAARSSQGLLLSAGNQREVSNHQPPTGELAERLTAEAEAADTTTGCSLQEGAGAGLWTRDPFTGSYVKRPIYGDFIARCGPAGTAGVARTMAAREQTRWLHKIHDDSSCEQDSKNCG